ncbi:MAG TPA: hypothetical protein VM433_12955 [Mycobacteriales bacterium]|nr:hypothetical protein [Mycobacteriales bacterium]
MRTRWWTVAPVLLVLGALPASAQETVAWAPSLPTGKAISVSLSLVEGGVGYALLADADVPGSRLVRTDDSGRTWAPVVTGQPFGPSSRARFVDADRGWAIDGAQLLSTDDGGRTWSPARLPEPAEQRRFVHHDTLDARGDVVAIGLETSADVRCGEDGRRRAEIAVNDDGGAGWAVADLGLEGRVRDLDVQTPAAGAVVVRETRTTSVPSDLPLLGGGGCTTVVRDVPDSTTVFLVEQTASGLAPRRVLDCGPADCHQVARPARDRVVVGMGDGTVRVSEDGGVTFRDAVLDVALRPEGTPVVVTGIAFADERTGSLATAGHGLHRTTDGGRTWVREVAPATLVATGRGDLAVAPGGAALAAGSAGILRRVQLAD